MDIKDILNLNDTSFILWCQQLLKEKCNKNIDRSDLNIKLIPYLKELVKKYYDPKKINITITETIPKNEELPSKVLIGSPHKKSQIFIESPYSENKHLTKEDIIDIEKNDQIFLDENWVEQNDKLIAKNTGLKLYTHYFDNLINSELRSEDSKISEIIYKIIKQIIDRLDNVEPYPKRLCLYRGVGEEYTDSVLKKMKIGDKIINKGFSSQTLDIYVAEEFANKNDSGSIMMLCYPSKTKILYLEGLTIHPEEHEVLTYPNTEIKLIDITTIKIKHSGFKKEYYTNYDMYVFSVNIININIDTYNIKPNNLDIDISKLWMIPKIYRDWIKQNL